MSSSPETFLFTQQIACADADNAPIREGSVLREIKDGERGVVTRIVRASDTVAPFASCIGDLVISISGHPSIKRVTNRYSQWKHIPQEQQTYEERFLSWMHRPFEHDPDKSISQDEQLAVNGIMALLPRDIVNSEYGPWPDHLEDALRFLTYHLTVISSPS